MDKYIFLDIDGVIATPDRIVDGEWALVDTCQDNLGEILNKTNAYIVLSSSWRKNTLKNTIYYMSEMGFKYTDKIVGITIRSYKYLQKGIHLSIPRGVEIKQWIDTNVHSDNGKNFIRKELGKDYNYVILDDHTDMLLEHRNNFIRTDSRKGLNEEDVIEAINILNYETSN